MTEEGVEREERRRTRSGCGLLGLLVLSAALVGGTHSFVPLIELVALLFVVWGGFAFLVERESAYPRHR